MMTIEERLTQLERKNRRLTWALVLAGLVATLAVGVGMAAPEAIPYEVKAHKFTLVDENGKVRASLDVVKSGPVLSLNNEKVRASLSVLTGLSLYDENGKVRASVDVLKGDPGLSLYDENGKVRASVGVGEGGGGIVDVSNALGKRVATIQANKTNCGMVIVYDQNGELKRSLTAD